MSNDPRFFQAVELTTATYDRIASNYAERNERMSLHWSERMEQFVDLLAQAAAAYPIPELGGRPGDDIALDEYLQFVPVLDAGCGTGRDARALAAHDLPVLGVDLSQGMLDEAGERTARRLPHGSIRYALMDLRRLELPDTCCRGVWCSASLLHLPHRTAPRAVAELARVAHRGAPLAIFLKRRREHEEPERFIPYEHADTPDALRFYAYYTEGEARALVESAGLIVTDIATASDPRFPEALGWVSLLATKP